MVAPVSISVSNCVETRLRVYFARLIYHEFSHPAFSYENATKKISNISWIDFEKLEKFDYIPRVDDITQ